MLESDRLKEKDWSLSIFFFYGNLKNTNSTDSVLFQSKNKTLLDFVIWEKKIWKKTCNLRHHSVKNAVHWLRWSQCN